MTKANVGECYINYNRKRAEARRESPPEWHAKIFSVLEELGIPYQRYQHHVLNGYNCDPPVTLLPPYPLAIIHAQGAHAGKYPHENQDMIDAMARMTSKLDELHIPYYIGQNKWSRLDWHVNLLSFLEDVKAGLCPQVSIGWKREQPSTIKGDDNE